MGKLSRIWKPYIFPWALVTLILFVQIQVRSLVANRVFILLYPTPLICAVLGGFWSGMLAVVIALAGVYHFFIPPRYFA